MRYKVVLHFFYINSLSEVSDFTELFYINNLVDLPKELDEIFSGLDLEKVTLKEMSVYPVIKKNWS